MILFWFKIVSKLLVNDFRSCDSLEVWRCWISTSWGPGRAPRCPPVAPRGSQTVFGKKQEFEFLWLSSLFLFRSSSSTVSYSQKCLSRYALPQQGVYIHTHFRLSTTVRSRSEIVTSNRVQDHIVWYMVMWQGKNTMYSIVRMNDRVVCFAQKY